MVSIVFDYITYNGNLDTFSYSEVSFSVRDTGKIDYNARSTNMPLNVLKGGIYLSIFQLTMFFLILVRLSKLSQVKGLHTNLTLLKLPRVGDPE